jgi:DNA ligase (NAD+)
MTKAEAKRRIEKLRQEIAHHRYLYHVRNIQEISDAALDSLKKELFDLEQQYPDLITPDSPTQRVAGEALAQFTKVAHAVRMLSLNDAFNETDMVEWIERLQRVDPKAELTFFAETKMDGLALSLVYEDGGLQVAATRGNGLVGEDVTHNVRTMESVPLRLREVVAARGVRRIEVRGEAYLSRAIFNRINRQREKAGLETYMNPRNTAAGTIRQLDPKLAAERQLQFMAYALVTDLGQQSHADEHTLLQDLGFATDPAAAVCPDLAAVMALYKKIGQRREKLPYQIDGVVVQVNDNRLFRRFGVVGKAPRAAIALKFPAEQTTTVVEDIQVQVGRTGALTPVAHLRPVEVAGTTVARATLHNMDEIARLGVKIGDTVVIEKAGDIIPDVVQVLPKLRTGREQTFRMPRRCPVCHQPVKRQAGEVAYYCTNRACPARHREGLYHFVSRQGLDIEGLGPKLIDLLVDEGLVTDAADLFVLTAEQLAPLPGLGELSAKKLIAAIAVARRVPLARLIFALGIRHVGEQTAVVLAEQFGSLPKLRQASAERLEAIHDIGPAAAASLADFFADKKSVALLDRLEAVLTIERPTVSTGSGALAGQSFLFTGSLASMTRDEAKERVRQLGGRVLSTVSKELDFLVVGDEPGSKLAKAQKLGVTVLTEPAFLAKLG